MDALKRLVSLEEKRVSALMIGMLLTLIFALVMYWIRRDISTHLVDILEALIAGVVGVSVANVANAIWGKEKITDGDKTESV